MPASPSHWQSCARVAAILSVARSKRRWKSSKARDAWGEFLHMNSARRVPAAERSVLRFLSSATALHRAAGPPKSRHFEGEPAPAIRRGYARTAATRPASFVSRPRAGDGALTDLIPDGLETPAQFSRVSAASKCHLSR